jgi:hypothetical protein
MQHLGIIVLTNGYPTGVAEALAASFFDFAFYGKQTQDWFAIYKKALAAAVDEKSEFDYSKPPASASLPSANKAYVGTYTNLYVGDVNVMEKDGGLAMTLGPQRLMFRIKHYNRDTFTYETPGENSVGTSGLTFSIDAAGQATAVTIYHLNAYGAGVFKRVSAPR